LLKSNVLNIMYACRSFTAVAYQLGYSFNSATKIVIHWLTHRTVCYCFMSLIVRTLLTDHLMCLLNHKFDFFLCFYANGCEYCNEHWGSHEMGSTSRLTAEAELRCKQSVEHVAVTNSKLVRGRLH
jgi:hypothetical protein